MKQLLITLAFVLTTWGCTIVKTQKPYASVEYYFGIPFINFSTDAHLQYNSVESIGIGISDLGGSLGYSKRQQFLQKDPSECSVVLFFPDNTDLNQFIETLENADVSLDQLCIFKE
ncbi:hypothetical protein [Vibrio cyclitrophicus]|uniref:hypothetical protein n=1 Tax=Vibrio cyclitrophicus TaxID=47951 RepID=UPI000C84CCCE|nr:hypothetical protein [Vibrio cyclitrophicus]PMJ73429.1 hypothetical protein BCU15_04555 [Vibrio cyclitrophicus]